ncbi:glycosyltransferase family 39 protein [Candidatus Roizmanbacteria bacterium]|nr:glycosyltransferase family 39 protein [Candidatus Roizmanbacteria bacterium]
MRRIYSYLILTSIVLISTFVLWRGVGFLTIYKHYDGPLYVVVAKTFYNPVKIEQLKLATTLNPKYFAAHLPLYPALIRVVREIGVFRKLGYLKAMVGVNLLSTIGLVLFFYYLLKKFKLTKNPLMLATVFLFLPRFLIVRTVGAPESLFILLILLSLFFFEKDLPAGRQGKFWLAGLFGGLATMTKTPGILLFAGYGLVFIERLIKEKKISWHWLGIILIPLGLLGVFGLYGIQYKDFFAYFHSGDNIHLVFPYSVFNFQKPWVGTAWLEEILFYYFIYGLAIINLKDNKYRSFFYFGLVFFTAALFVQHRDISRYSLPLWPLGLIAFEKFFISKRFLIVFLILLPAIYLYAWNFLGYNIMPIADWKPFL